MYSKSLGKPLNTEESQLDVHDRYNRKLLKGSFQKVDKESIVLAHHRLVVPAYLIEIEEKTDADDIVDGILYSCLKKVRYTSAADSSLNRITNK